MRVTWVKDLIDRAVYLDLHGNTPYPQALGLSMSFLQAYFDSSVHQQHVKAEESQQKIVSAVIGRLDSVIKAIGYLGKALRGR